MNIVAAVKCKEYSKEKIKKKLKKGISLVKSDLTNSKNIVIKPNISSIHSVNNITHPVVIESLIELIRSKNKNAKIYIVESDTHNRTADEAFKINNYDALAKNNKNVELVNLSKDKQLKIKTESELFKKANLPLTLFNCDFLINVGKMKTDEFQRSSGVLKNQLGLIPEFNSKDRLFILSDAIVEINKIIKPDLCIIDAITAIEGRGPELGKPREEGLLLFSNNAVAIDAVSTKYMGFSPSSNPHLYLASKKINNYNSIHLAGDTIENKKFKFINLATQLMYKKALNIQRLSYLKEQRIKQRRKKAKHLIEKGKFISYTLERYGKDIFKKAYNRFVKKQAF